MGLSRKRVKVRVAFSLVLCVLLVFEMLYDFTGNLLHELVSIAFAVVLIVHIVLARKWIAAACRASLHKKTRKAKNVIRLIVLFVILVAAIVLAITSVLISELLEKAGIVLFLPGFDRFTLRIIHTISAYALCAATVVHVALHYLSAVKALHIPYDPARRKVLDTAVAGVAAIGVIALSVFCYSDISQREHGSVEGKGRGNGQGNGSGRKRNSA